jgi:3-phosphoshikimate 1-carboxyvinyltransferase
MSYPPQIAIRPLAIIPRATVRVPGSKSITNRALVLAALTAMPDRDLDVDGALQSEDTEVMVESLRRLGFHAAPDWSAGRIRMRGVKASTRIPASAADLFVANSGTSMRFLTALVSLGEGRYRLDGVPRMRERPIADLLTALQQLGVSADSEMANGCPPVTIAASGLRGGVVRIRGDVSSQFLSGLLMAAPFAQSELVIEIEGMLVSVPYVDMTVAMMRLFGLSIAQDRPDRYRVPTPQQPTPPPRYVVEPDASAASYFFAAAAITGGSITVPDLTEHSLQGDVRFVRVLQQMGCNVDYHTGGITVRGGPLHGIDVDMNDISDTVMTLGVVACFAAGPTVIRRVAHIRHKETDRLTALATELRRIGAGVDEHEDGLRITPAPLHGATISTYDDHRMAMSLALAGLRIPGIVIDQPGCVAKTYPRFFDDLQGIGDVRA